MVEKRRVLFVDDERSILDGLRRLLRPLRSEWDMEFASSGDEALAIAAAGPVDVVVSDMRMPGMNGAELLRHFHDLYPRTVRFILSGHSEQESVMAAAEVAHQWMSKPCEAEVVRSSVCNALALSDDSLENRDVAELAGGVDAVPPAPEVYRQLLAKMADPDSGMGEVAELIESDVAMSAKIMQLVNSSFFGLPHPISDLPAAINMLGLSTVRDLVLSSGVFEPPDGLAPVLADFFDELQARSAAIAKLSRDLMAHDPAVATQSFTAGIVHDVGYLVLAISRPDQLEQLVLDARERAVALHIAEHHDGRPGHAELGAFLLGLWGLPYPILEAAAYHHRPGVVPEPTVAPLTAVHVASGLIDARLDGQDPEAELDLDYLARLGVADQLPGWVDQAAAIDLSHLAPAPAGGRT